MSIQCYIIKLGFVRNNLFQWDISNHNENEYYAHKLKNKYKNYTGKVLHK